MCLNPFVRTQIDHTAQKLFFFARNGQKRGQHTRQMDQPPSARQSLLRRFESADSRSSQQQQQQWQQQLLQQQQQQQQQQPQHSEPSGSDRVWSTWRNYYQKFSKHTNTIVGEVFRMTQWTDADNSNNDNDGNDYDGGSGGSSGDLPRAAWTLSRSSGAVETATAALRSDALNASNSYDPDCTAGDWTDENGNCNNAPNLSDSSLMAVTAAKTLSCVGSNGEEIGAVRRLHVLICLCLLVCEFICCACS